MFGHAENKLSFVVLGFVLFSILRLRFTRPNQLFNCDRLSVLDRFLLIRGREAVEFRAGYFISVLTEQGIELFVVSTPYLG